MAKLTLHGKVAESQPGETVLAALLRSGASVGHSCLAGSCQSCLLRATAGTPADCGQVGLRDTLRQRGYFLPCITPATEDLTLTTADEDGLQVTATLVALDWLTASVLRLRLQCDAPLPYRAGQFINLVRDDGLCRSYSLASVPDLDPFLELHVRIHPGGRMSGWLAGLSVGQRLGLRGPAGDCFYVAGRPAQPLLLIGSGTGLAPLYGIARDALAQGHSGPIVLMHGARQPEGLYYRDELAQLAADHPSLQLRPCVLGPSTDLPADVSVAPLADHLRSLLPKLTGWRAFLCGDPALVVALRRQIFLAGASRNDIAADAFTTAPSEPAPARDPSPGPVPPPS